MSCSFAGDRASCSECASLTGGDGRTSISWRCNLISMRQDTLFYVHPTSLQSESLSLIVSMIELLNLVFAIHPISYLFPIIDMTCPILDYSSLLIRWTNYEYQWIFILSILPKTIAHSLAKRKFGCKGATEAIRRVKRHLDHVSEWPI